MNMDELARLTGKTRMQLEEEFKETDVIELKLVEGSRTEEKDDGKIEILG